MAPLGCMIVSSGQGKALIMNGKSLGLIRDFHEA
jgi:hypothetical protein